MNNTNCTEGDINDNCNVSSKQHLTHYIYVYSFFIFVYMHNSCVTLPIFVPLESLIKTEAAVWVIMCCACNCYWSFHIWPFMNTSGTLGKNNWSRQHVIIIDREAREIMYLVASVRQFVSLSVCPSAPVWTVYQSQVFVCVSVISGRVRIIVRMRSIGF